MLGVQRAQVGIRRRGFCGRVDDLLRLEKRQLAIEELAQGRRIGPAAARVAGVFQDGQAQCDLGVGARRARKLGAGYGRQGRQPERRRLQAPIVGAADLADNGLAGGCRASRAHPHGIVLPACVERDQRGTILAVGRGGATGAGRQPGGELLGELGVAGPGFGRSHGLRLGSVSRLVARRGLGRSGGGRRRVVGGHGWRRQQAQDHGNRWQEPGQHLLPPGAARRRYRTRAAKARRDGRRRRVGVLRRGRSHACAVWLPPREVA